jgi:hypothetical protein
MPGVVRGTIVAVRVPVGPDGRFGFTVNYGNAVTQPGPAAEHGLRCWDKVVSYNGVHLGDRRLADVIAAQNTLLPSVMQLKRSNSSLKPKEATATDEAVPLSLSPRSTSLALPAPDGKQCRLLVLRLVSRDVRSLEGASPQTPPTSSPRKVLSFRRNRKQVSPRDPSLARRRERKSPSKHAGRPRIKEQWLLQRVDRGDSVKWQPRRASLSTQEMLYGEAGKAARVSISLLDVTRVEVGYPEELIFTVCTHTRSHVFRASDKSQFIYWVSELMLLTRDYQAHGQYEPQSRTASAPSSRQSSPSRRSDGPPHGPPPTVRLSSADRGVLEAYASSALGATDFGDYDDCDDNASEISLSEMFDDYDDIPGDDAPGLTVRRELSYESIPEDGPVTEERWDEDDLFKEIDSELIRVAAL